MVKVEIITIEKIGGSDMREIEVPDIDYKGVVTAKRGFYTL